MQITYDSSTLHLEDMPLDVGYASERIDLKNSTGEKFTIGGQNGSTQLFISAPFINDDLMTQLNE
ncbi:MAG: hypothetical protein JZU62_04915, partial [Sulfuricurvum sp.]|uniref:hypothetical protein n=1 Tax=Sulfuricurvum sp. TaxID=2025608 RepID=UPI0025EE41FF